MNRKYFERDRSHLKTTPFGIFTDQAGYFPDSVKRAVLPFECDRFDITDLSGNVVYSGETAPFGFDEASGDSVCTADFSALRREGEYRVTAAGRLSPSFRIGEDVYDNVLHDTAKAFYFLRCGCGLDEQYAGQYRHQKCHCAPAAL
ncbi:MAG: hypothetical protein IKP95_08405 [Ruminococcus sp.]|nr:hypothetical protein [Ruminococcus sp.]